MVAPQPSTKPMSACFRQPASSACMAIAVGLAELALANLSSWQRLPLLVALGGASYLALLYVVSRATLDEVIGLLARRKPRQELQPAE